mmetsp:Transcript_4163/g.9319  ORF Transcript_4163/g.9319 Transcript_4163/m.9319 type:complete len:210 (-) Transcript_4163:50-679(-)
MAYKLESVFRLARKHRQQNGVFVPHIQSVSSVKYHAPRQQAERLRKSTLCIHMNQLNAKGQVFHHKTPCCRHRQRHHIPHAVVRRVVQSLPANICRNRHVVVALQCDIEIHVSFIYCPVPFANVFVALPIGLLVLSSTVVSSLALRTLVCRNNAADKTIPFCPQTCLYPQTSFFPQTFCAHFPTLRPTQEVLKSVWLSTGSCDVEQSVM